MKMYMNNRKFTYIFLPLKALVFLLMFLGGCNFAIQQNNWAVQDLLYTRDTILENHPGTYNTLDPNFPTNLETNYKAAQNRLITAQSDTDRMTILKKFVASFNDTHVQIGFFEQKNRSTPHDSLTQHFTVYQPNQHFTWITLPTFEPNDEQKKELEKLYQELPLLRSEKALVFDIRGNGGGNSDWAENIVTSLFGEPYACEHINRAQAGTYLDWRASKDNLVHMIKIKQEIERNIASNDDSTQRLSNVIDGMQKALETKQPFYTEKELSLSCTASDHPKNPVKAKIFVIIDHACGSAALDFIDYLKAMKHPITLVGQTTKADSLYMEIRTIPLPSNKGAFAIPIKIYRNRIRGHNEPYKPDIYWDTKQDVKSLHAVISNVL